jgi:hypothetical protein
MYGALCKANISYLLKEPETNEMYAAHSKTLALKLYDKLQGPALQLFTFISAEQYYMEGDGGIELIRVLARTFNPMDAQAVSKLINKLRTISLPATMDLGVFFGIMNYTNEQLGWVGQGMSEMYLVTHAMNRLHDNSS